MSTTRHVRQRSERAEIIESSREFGRRVRELEDKQQFEEMKAVRVEWRRFSNHLDRKYRRGSLDAYFDEYCREPADGEYEEEAMADEVRCSSCGGNNLDCLTCRGRGWVPAPEPKKD